MRTILISILILAFAGISHAGGPDIQIDKAKIEDVAVDHRGVVLRVSGIARLFVPKVEGDVVAKGEATWISLPMKSAEIRYLYSKIYLPSSNGLATYKARIEAMKGTEQLLQMWGTQATIEDGHVTRISTQSVNALFPQKGERMYSIDRLEELREEPASK